MQGNPAIKAAIFCNDDRISNATGKTEIIAGYSGVHKSPPPFFSKILEKPSIVQKKTILHINGLGFALI